MSMGVPGRGSPYLSWGAAFIVGLAGVAALWLRFYGLSGDYVSYDSYAQLVGGLHFLDARGHGYGYVAPPGAALLLLPALILSRTELAAQVAVGLWGVLLAGISGWLVWRVTRLLGAALLFTLLVALNPTLVFLSRGIWFENFLLVIVALTILLCYRAAEEAGDPEVPLLLWAIFGLTLLATAIRTPSMLILPLGLLYIGRRRGYLSRSGLRRLLRSRWAWGGLGTAGLIAGAYFLSQPTEAAKIVTAARGTFALANLARNWAPALYVLSNPLLTPPTAVFDGPSFYELLGGRPEPASVLAAMLQLPLVFIGGYALVVEGRRDFCAFLVALAAVLSLFYSFYVEFISRYYLPAIYVELFLLTRGLSYLLGQRVQGGRLLPTAGGVYAVIVVAALAASGAAAMVPEIRTWGSRESRANQQVYLTPREVRRVLDLAVAAGVDEIVTDYAPYVEFYALSQERYAGVAVFDLYKHAVARGVTRKSAAELLAHIQAATRRGKKVWLFLGWPTIRAYDPGLTETFRFFYDVISSQRALTVVLRGEPTVFNRVPQSQSRNFFLLEVGAEVPVSDEAHVVASLPAHLVGHTRPDLDTSDATQRFSAEVKIPLSAPLGLQVAGTLRGRGTVRLVGAGGAAVTLVEGGESGASFSRSVRVSPPGGYALVIDSGERAASFDIRITPVGIVVFDFVDEFASARRFAKSQSYARIEQVDINADSRRSLFLHPVSRIVYRVAVPRGRSVLTFGMGLMPAAWANSDGVLFELAVRVRDRQFSLFSQEVRPRSNQAHRRWVDGRVDMSRFGGQVVEVIFSTAAGSRPDSTLDMDWAVWGDPVLYQLVDAR